ncbi:MAG: hypothetical protein AAF637_07110 [Pseudomonadota bacterium]
MQPVTHKTDAGDLMFAPIPGNIQSLTFRTEGQELRPLHRAPWADESEVAGDPPPVERHLSGDFFCAPFGSSDVEDAPPHGWPANGRWTEIATENGLAFSLDQTVMGSRIEKRLRLAEDAPILYQEHRIIGGEGRLSLAHHPMNRAAGGGRLSFSKKRIMLTPDQPLEPGRATLAYPAESVDPTAFPGVTETIDLTRLPIGERTEDFVLMVEAEGNALGWTAVIREVEDDIVLILKDPAVLPVTMFWHSNAGRDYAPWEGRHDRVIGIEDGCAEGTGGHAAALASNRVSALGIPTALDLAPDRVHRIAHVIAAIPRPFGWDIVTNLTIAEDSLIVSGPAGEIRELAFNADFFSRSN